MPTSGTSGRSSRDTRQRILDAARRLGHEKGYTGTTMAAISREAGVHPGSVYWSFADKDAVFAAVIRETYAADIADEDPEQGGLERVLSVLEHAINDPRRLGQWRFNVLLLLDPKLADTESRKAFQEVREITVQRLIGHWLPQLPPDAHHVSQRMATAALALVDGALIAAVNGQDVDMEWLAGSLTAALDEAVERAWAESSATRPSR